MRIALRSQCPIVFDVFQIFHPLIIALRLHLFMSCSYMLSHAVLRHLIWPNEIGYSMLLPHDSITSLVRLQNDLNSWIRGCYPEVTDMK